MNAWTDGGVSLQDLTSPGKSDVNYVVMETVILLEMFVLMLAGDQLVSDRS